MNAHTIANNPQKKLKAQAAKENSPETLQLNGLEVEIKIRGNGSGLSSQKLGEIEHAVAQILGFGVRADGDSSILDGIAEGAREASDRSGPRGAGLTRHQVDFITQGGTHAEARYVAAQQRVDAGVLDAHIQKTAARAAASSLSSAEVAELLSIDASRVRHRYNEGSLFGFKSGRVLRYPDWQFDSSAEQKVLPGMVQITRALSPTMHQATVRGLMTTRQDILLINEERVSPVDWLVSGGDLQKVLEVIEGYRAW